jgi:predicted enzyme related to lactoylglutathione lyase
LSTIDPQALCQIEIQVSHLDKAQEFYLNVFGWRPTPAEFADYTIMQVPENCPYGIALIQTKHQQNRNTRGPIIYFNVPSIQKIINCTLKYGGQKFGPLRPVPGVGQTQVITDPDGNAWGLLQEISAIKPQRKEPTDP